MPNDDQNIVPPTVLEGRTRPQTQRTLLGVLLALLLVAVVLAIWFLLFDNDGPTASDPEADPGPTPLVVATSTPSPDDTIGLDTTGEVEPTAAPVATATSLPEGLQPCSDADAPNPATTYIVDTNTTPLNQRTEPSVDGEQVGAFDPAETGLVFTGECVVNAADGYTWWRIFNGTDDVWIASSFVTPE